MNKIIYLPFFTVILFCLISSITSKDIFMGFGIASLLLIPLAIIKPRLALPMIPTITRKILIPILIATFFIGVIFSKPTDKQKVTEITLKPTLTLVPTNTIITSQTIKRELYTVTKVIDEDTIDINLNGVNTRLRLIGIDAPKSVDHQQPVECLSKEATNFTKQTLEGKLVYLEADNSQGDKDKYNLLLRYVFLEDNTHINKLLIEDGYAHEYTHDLPYKYQKEFKQAQKVAQENKRGLWAYNTCATPSPTNKPALIPTNSLIPQKKLQYNIDPTNQPALLNNNGVFVCNCAKTCSKMSCDEAYFQLKQCGCVERDGNSDGVPCESVCK